MALMEHVLKAGKDILLAGLKKHLLRKATNRWLEIWQKTHELDITRFMNDTGHSREQAIEKIGGYVADKSAAEKRALADIEMGVGRRLEGAIACFGAGKQLECIRHILLALDSIAIIEGWSEASKYLNEQNNVLFEQHKRSEAA